MNLDLQFKIASNPTHQLFLRENSYWYKILNRNPERFNDFLSEMKERYKLRASDKVNDIAEKLDMIRMFLNVLK